MKLSEIKTMIAEFEANGATNDSEIDFMICDANDNHDSIRVNTNIRPLEGKDTVFEIYVDLDEKYEVVKAKSTYKTVRELASDFHELYDTDWKEADLEDYISIRFGYVMKGHDCVSFEYSDIEAYFSLELESSTSTKRKQ